MLEMLSPDAIAGRPLRAELRRLVEDWGGRATTDSAGFRMVRAWRLFVAETVFDALTVPCREADERFSYNWYGQREGPLDAQRRTDDMVVGHQRTQMDGVVVQADLVQAVHPADVNQHVHAGALLSF